MKTKPPLRPFASIDAKTLAKGYLFYLNDIIKGILYMASTLWLELLDMLPHKWKLRHPEDIMVTKHQLIQI